MQIHDKVRQMKNVSPLMASSALSVRNRALDLIAESLRTHQDEIFAANREDLQRADETGIAPAVRKRLIFDSHKLADVLSSLKSLRSLPDPVGKVTLKRELDSGLLLKRVTIPIGVIGIIFEARPDALVQISSLCIKSGNCAVLKGGRETASTNQALFSLIRAAALSAGLPDGCLLQASAHSEVDELLQCDDCVDLLIPRGSNAFVRYIMENTKIPVMGHSDGICSVYVDDDADFGKAIPIIIDAKTQYTAACNAAETLLVNRGIADDFLPEAAAALAERGVRLRGTAEAAEILSKAPHSASSAPAQIAPSDLMEEEDFRKEYLDLVLSVKLVDSVEEAAAHINRWGSHHTDCIITENPQHAETFMTLVDSAGVYQNCSTRFADGYRYGFGAEVGISTGKLHARGPVGLDGLVTFKYRLYGSGQIVGDYADGKKSFHFRDLPLEKDE